MYDNGSDDGSGLSWHHAHVQGVRLFSSSRNRGTVGRPSTFDLVRGDESQLQLLAKDVIVSATALAQAQSLNAPHRHPGTNAGGVQGQAVGAGRDGRLGEGSRKSPNHDHAHLHSLQHKYG